MSQVKLLEDAVENANTAYKRCKSSLSRALPQQQQQPDQQQQPQVVCSTRSLKVKMKALDEAVSALNTAHTSWVSKAKLSTEDLAAHSFSSAWLENEWIQVDNLMDRAGDLVHDADEPSIKYSSSSSHAAGTDSGTTNEIP